MCICFVYDKPIIWFQFKREDDLSMSLVTKKKFKFSLLRFWINFIIYEVYFPSKFDNFPGHWQNSLKFEKALDHNLFSLHNNIPRAYVNHL